MQKIHYILLCGLLVGGHFAWAKSNSKLGGEGVADCRNGNILGSGNREPQNYADQVKHVLGGHAQEAKVSGAIRGGKKSSRGTY